MTKQIFLFAFLFAFGFASFVQSDCLCPKQVLGSRITLVADIEAQKWPVAAFDSVNGNFFLAWTTTEDSITYKIKGQLFDSFGAAISGPFEFDKGPSSRTSAVVFNSINEEFLVLWISGTTLHGQMITFDGRIAGQKLKIATFSPLFSINDYHVIFNSKQNEYLIVYSLTKFKRSEIYLQRLDRFGNRIRPPQKITGNKYQRPQIEYDTESNRYILVWESLQSGFNKVLYQIYSSFLQKITSVRQLNSLSTNEVAPRIVYNPIQKQFILFWQDCYPCRSLRTRAITPDGFLGQSGSINLGSVEIRDIRVNRATPGYLILYQTSTSRSPQLARLSQNLSNFDKNIFTNCQIGRLTGFSSLLYNTLKNEFFVVWTFISFTPQNDDIFAQRIRAIPQSGDCPRP